MLYGVAPGTTVRIPPRRCTALACGGSALYSLEELDWASPQFRQTQSGGLAAQGAWCAAGRHLLLDPNNVVLTLGRGADGQVSVARDCARCLSGVPGLDVDLTTRRHRRARDHDPGSGDPP